MIGLRLTILILLLIFSVFINLLGLMKIFPLLFSAPLLFLSIFFLISTLNQRNRFRGFPPR
ncbi:hypothetical protein [Bacillus sp. B-jedd]|uniref:hypothetical protein n=1 Tax=Bacillus sp. B-jedd TaxID=1476857 RepID=UPI0005157196|nr:hypothetical protein [Bacillus sp. B-jedd]CEG26116.1 hypothetical protein BN1002_00956 [Bacillus sp. B-jedd]